MGRGSSDNRFDRLQQLTGLLKSGDTYTSSALAKQLGVSQRTLQRDIESLRHQGLPVEADPGRGGGVRLPAYWGSGRLNLNSSEILDLLLAVTVMEKLSLPLFGQQLTAVRHKLHSAFPDQQRTKLRALRKRILVGQAASAAVLTSTRATPSSALQKAVQHAFFQQMEIEILYQKTGGEPQQRRVQPHYLLLNWPVWYLLVFDHLRGAVRTFRLDRISRITPLETAFRVLPISAFDEQIAALSNSL